MHEHRVKRICCQSWVRKRCRAAWCPRRFHSTFLTFLLSSNLNSHTDSQSQR